MTRTDLSHSSTPTQASGDEPGIDTAQNFVETALKLGGKSEEEARTTGKIDRADDQVEALFATRYQTAHSPVHRAVWGRTFPIELFQPAPPAVPEGCRRVMEDSIAV